MTKKEEQIAAAKERDAQLIAAAKDFEADEDQLAEMLENAPNLGRYSAANLQLLILQAFERDTLITDVRSMGDWSNAGRAIAKGSAGFRIWAPCRPSKKRIEEAKAEGASDAQARRVRGFRLVSVFDAAQTVPGKKVTGPNGFTKMVPDPEADPRVGLDRAEPTEAEKDAFALRTAELEQRGYEVTVHEGEPTMGAAVSVDHEGRQVEIDADAADGAILAGLVMACRDAAPKKRSADPAPQGQAAPEPVRLAI